MKNEKVKINIRRLSGVIFVIFAIGLQLKYLNSGWDSVDTLSVIFTLLGIHLIG